jgi:hypothetical protein
MPNLSTYHVVSLSLKTGKSISIEGEKMNMNLYPSQQIYCLKFSMHILLLEIFREYAILVPYL